LIAKTGMLRGYAKEDLQFVESLLEQVGIRELSDTPIGDLSGGQQQRAFIARSVAARPQLLLLDEPTTGIDAGAQQKFIEFLQELRSNLKLTLVFTTHDLRAAAALCDRIACLNVTLHAHDVPEKIPPSTLYGMFACDVEVLRNNKMRG
jgi:ABC-type Mn2+/Zn2+ transport system ATPase subunit